MSVVLPDRALTLWQPFAWLVASGLKPIENRPQGFSHKSFRGDFWIHASAAPSLEEWNDRWGQAHDLCIEILGRDPLMDAVLHHGAIIGRATITGIIPPVIDTSGNLYARAQPSLQFFRNTLPPLVPWHFPDQYGFRVENAELLETPVPCRGYQGFWRVPPPVLEKLAA